MRLPFSPHPRCMQRQCSTQSQITGADGLHSSLSFFVLDISLDFFCICVLICKMGDNISSKGLQ